MRLQISTNQTLDLVLLELLIVRSDLELRRNLHFFISDGHQGFKPASWDAQLKALFDVNSEEIVLHIFADRQAYIFTGRHVYGNIGDGTGKILIKNRRGIVKVFYPRDPVNDQIIRHKRDVLQFKNVFNVQDMEQLLHKVLEKPTHDFVWGSSIINDIKVKWPLAMVPPKI